MPKKTNSDRNRHEISVRGTTYDALRAYCRRHNVQMRSVIDELIAKALDEAQQREQVN